MITRKTRIVCISDTHNQTPKLPLGDVLIHAGDLTNQGSYAELKKTVEWIEKADFEAKIVIAGNHDTTLDEPFFHGSSNKWKWPQPQDPVKCRKLLTESTSITYLENEVAVIYLTSHNGPKTRFKIFGSPFSSGRRGWAFQYVEEADAVDLWEKIEEDVDIVVTHNPAYGHCDTAAKKQAGCPILLKRLALTRPMLHVCGHIHAGRGAERITWAPLSHTHNPPIGQPTTSLVESVEHWNDPGAGNKKLSLLDLTAKSRHCLDNMGRYLPHDDNLDLVRVNLGSTSALDDSASVKDEARIWRKKDGGAIEHRIRRNISNSDIDTKLEGVRLGSDSNFERNETAMVNAAIMGPRNPGKALSLNKPIVVDMELPVYQDFNVE